jgi:hypothetical protein
MGVDVVKRYPEFARELTRADERERGGGRRGHDLDDSAGGRSAIASTSAT